MAFRASQSFAFSTAVSDFTSYGELAYAVACSIVTNGPLGDNYLSVSSGPGSAAWNFPAALTTFFLGNRLANNGSAGNSILDLQLVSPNAVAQLTFTFSSSTGVISVYRGSGAGTLLGQSSPLAAPSVAFFYCEIGATINSSTGSVQVKIGAGPGTDSVTVINLTGVNTQNDGSAATVSQVLWTNNGVGASGVAHVYLCDSTGGSPWNTFLGDVRVFSCECTSNDAVQFTPNGLGSNYLNAALIPPVPATDYNSDATVNQQDTYNVAGVPSNLGVIYGATVVDLFAKSDAGGRSMATVLKSGSTTSVGTNIAVATSPLSARSVYELDPNTSAQWLQTNMTAGDIKVGAKITA